MTTQFTVGTRVRLTVEHTQPEDLIVSRVGRTYGYATPDGTDNRGTEIRFNLAHGSATTWNGRTGQVRTLEEQAEAERRDALWVALNDLGITRTWTQGTPAATATPATLQKIIDALLADST